MHITTNNEWFEATVSAINIESPTVKTLTFTAPYPIHNKAGQHFELRLTAENGYQAARLYSAVRAGSGEKTLQLTIMDTLNGEVSPYVTESLRIGDKVEIRGPFGNFFVWTPDEKRPVLLIGGGSGVVPMHAIFSAHQDSASTAKMHLLYSSRTFDDILYKDEFLDNKDVTITLTKDAPSDWQGKSGRINQAMVEEIVTEFPEKPLCYVCGMTKFVDAMTEALQANGITPDLIKTERFG
ncbi:hypothetical protein BGO18_03805 [Candidatus Saccharibacteria bacterium 47-87]|nr:MAG: hypothetical protein BGO18_03805 [Candidatus Saccharibacteria bacterium 47-87]